MRNRQTSDGTPPDSHPRACTHIMHSHRVYNDHLRVIELRFRCNVSAIIPRTCLSTYLFLAIELINSKDLSDRCPFCGVFFQEVGELPVKSMVTGGMEKEVYVLNPHQCCMCLQNVLPVHRVHVGRLMYRMFCDECLGKQRLSQSECIRRARVAKRRGERKKQ